MGKRIDRHSIIRSIIRQEDIRTQRDLVDALARRSYECTQATVSRDITEIGLVKSAQGYYVLPEDMQLKRMVGELVNGMEVVQNFLCIHTPPGIASSVTAALDAAHIEGIVGSLAGDDTIFVMTRSEKDAQAIKRLIHHLQQQ
ncbi:MAG: ArgR family transcriptional regulator [Eggerthellaceae bacterium]|nr:ArgR family transcriptional regulator [Eggerthellaceae bacterium]